MTSVLFGFAPARTLRLAIWPIRCARRGAVCREARTGLAAQSSGGREVALSLMLLVGAGLMMRTFMAVQDVDLGFRTDRLLTMRFRFLRTVSGS